MNYINLNIYKDAKKGELTLTLQNFILKCNLRKFVNLSKNA